MSVEWTDILITVFTGIIAIFAYLSYKIYKLTYRAYRLMSRPIVFAWLRDGKEEPGIRVENAGKGVAWNGNVVVTTQTSKSETEYGFTRLYEQSRYEYPIEGQPKLLFDPTRDKKIKIKITYEDEEKGGEKYEWEGEFKLHKEWLKRSSEKVV